MPRRSSAPPTHVVFVRHGLTASTGTVLPGRAKGLHLSPAGVAQAEAVATRLAEGPGDIAAVYSSPLERTRETAAPIGRALGLKVQVHKGLIECDFGEWTGERLADLAKLPEWSTVQSAPSRFRFPGGESFLEMQSRICGAVEQLVSQHVGETIVVTSHADPLKVVLAAAIGTPLDLFQRISLSPCSVSEVAYGTPRPTVLTLNATQRGEIKPS